MPNKDDAAEPGWPIREVTDPAGMRALAHPLRIRLLELLALRGPLTATECAAALGDTPSNCSFHLRRLARSGYVEEAPAGAGRRRPWRAVPRGTRFTSGPGAAPGTRVEADALARAMVDRNVARLYDYLEHRDAFGPQWSDAEALAVVISYLTPDELREVGAALLAIVTPYLDRLADPQLRPAGSAPVTFFLAGFPFEQEADNA